MALALWKRHRAPSASSSAGAAERTRAPYSKRQQKWRGSGKKRCLDDAVARAMAVPRAAGTAQRAFAPWRRSGFFVACTRQARRGRVLADVMRAQFGFRKTGLASPGLDRAYGANQGRRVVSDSRPAQPILPLCSRKVCQQSRERRDMRAAEVPAEQGHRRRRRMC
jgi:hypothetical protein